jgi:pimeloyl-ACP methyl ester carboxylesterase
MATPLHSHQQTPAPRSERLLMADGVGLRLDHWGSASGRRVLFAHGFGQSRHAWEDSARALAAQGYHCSTVDARGHGQSDWAGPAPYRLEHFIDDARHVADHVRCDVWVGASMGGLIGMMLAARQATPRCSALVLVDITPRWETEGVARIMRFMRAHPDGFDSLSHAQNAIAEYLPHRVRQATPERLQKLLVPMPNGRLRWHWDPTLLDTVAAEAEHWGELLHNAARALRVPVLLVSGGRSDVVSDRTIAEFLELVPHATHRRIADATHMVAGDDNERFTATILDYLDTLPRTPRAHAMEHA